jgi:Putative lumazine-binding
MKKMLMLLGFAMLISGRADAQKTHEETAVREVITRLFKGMEKGDSAMVHSTFAEEVSLLTAFRDKNNNPRLRRASSIDDFLHAVGTPHPEIWYEEIWDVEIQIDGDFAQGWCDYAFYFGHKFSHCGIDAFQFFKGKDGWKIVHLADTRRNTGCDIPKKVLKKHDKS